MFERVVRGFVEGRTAWRRLSAGLALAALGCTPRATPGSVGHSVPAPQATQVRSNVLRTDYVGSQACQPCHGEIYAAWDTSPMRRMTRLAGADAIRAPFAGEALRLGHDTATLEREDEQRFMRIATPAGTRRYRVTKVIGGRYREDYAGVDVTGEDDPAHAPGQGREQVLPVSFVFSTRSLRYKGYSVMLPERPALRAGPVWAATCIGCHNTLPLLDQLYDDLLGPGAAPYQGSVHDGLMPEERRWSWKVSDEDGLKAALGAELSPLGEAPDFGDAPLRQALAGAIEVTRHQLDAQHLVDLGVGCEACHGGAREHVEDASLHPSFEPTSPLFRVDSSAPIGRSEAINHACARCHSVLFSRYSWTWEGASRQGSDPGGSTTNSGEARDFLLGGCARQLDCTSCHDPHREDSRERLDALARPEQNGVCVSCHSELASEPALRAHSHHRSDGPGAACVGCHMPRKNMGLDYGLSRYHRIGSPTDEARVLGDRPLECALCHADGSVEGLVETMERWWGKHYSRTSLAQLYGADLNVNALESTLLRGKPHEQAVAIARFGESGSRAVLPRLVPALSHRYPLIRLYAKAAIERITGAPLGIDVQASESEVRASALAWLAARQREPR